MAIEQVREEAKIKRKGKVTHASSPKENLMEAVVIDVMNEEVNKHGKVMAPKSKRRMEKAKKQERRSTQVHLRRV